MEDQVVNLAIDKYGVTVVCAGDFQWGADGFCKESYQEFKWKTQKTPNVKYLLLGDYGDAYRPTMRARMRGAIDSDSHRLLDDQFRSHQDKLIDMMEFMKGKIIGLHNGHHCHIFADGTNSDQRIATALKAPYLDWIASTRLTFNRKDSNESHIYNIVSMHGSGGGGATGATLRFLAKQAEGYPNADHIIGGHACKSEASEPHLRNFIRERGPAGRLDRYVRLLAVGGFRRGFIKGKSGYEEIAGYIPQAIGWGEITFKMTSKKEIALARGLEYLPNARSNFLEVDHKSCHPLVDQHANE